MRNRIITLIFLGVLFFFGIHTGFNVWNAINNADGKGQPQTEALSSENIQLNGFDKETLNEISNLVTLNLEKRNQWINLNGFFQKMTGKKGDVEKDWYQLENGMLMYSQNKEADNDLKRYADNIVNLSQLAEDCGMKFLYVELPYKVQTDGGYPSGIPDYGNRNADGIMKNLLSKSVQTMDFRDIMKKKKMKSEDVFFRTDQHWKAESAIWAAGEISRKMSKIDSEWQDVPKYGNLENYRREHHAKLFLGSIGKKIGKCYAGIDDFDIMIPKFETQFRYHVPREENAIDYRGDFKTAFIETDNLEKDEFRVNTYAAYCDGDHNKEQVTNENALNRRNILLIRDSFSCTLMPYLALYTENITTLDLRHYKTKFVYEYIRKHPEIDTVIVAYNPSSITEEQYTFDRVINEEGNSNNN